MQDNRAIEALQTQGTWSSKRISSLPDDFLIDAISPSIPINQGSLELSVTDAIEDFGGNTYILGQYREKNESDDIFLPPMQDMQWDGYFVSKVDSNGDSLYVNIENNENQYNSGWGQISLGDEGSLRFITTIDNSGGMPSQDREDAGYQGITADSNRAGFITSFDASGSRQWTTLVTGDDIYSYAQSMVTDKDGNSYIYYGDSSWWMPKHLSKVDSDGNIAWNQENIFDVELNSKGASSKPYGGVVAVDGESNPIIAAEVGTSADVDISLWIADKSTGEIGNSIGTATTVDEKWWTWEIDASDVPNGIFESSLFDFAGTSEVSSSDLIFTTSLTKADGKEAESFKVASHGTQADQSTKYILNVEVSNNSGTSLEGVDFTLNFADPLFKEMFDNHVSITENLDLANSASIDAEGGGVRVMAGSAGNLTEGASGIANGFKSTIASFLLDIDDSKFVNGLDGLETAGITITANLDQTVFGDLTTLRDRGGVDAYSIGSEDISVVMAEAELVDVTSVTTQMGQDQNGFVLGTVRETGVEVGVNDFSNLIRSGATLYEANSTWTNKGDITATDVKLTLDGDISYLDLDAIELSIDGVQQAAIHSTDFDLNNVAINDSITIGYAIKANGDAGSVFSGQDIGYEIFAAGGKSFRSTSEYLDSINLITYQGDLNLDGTVSMLDLAYLNSGALDGAKDTDADFNGKIDMDDLEYIDSDWGESLHTGDKKFIGSDQMDWSDLSSSEDGASWTDRNFQKQNAIEAGGDFQNLLQLDEMGASELKIESDYFQDNDLESADIL